MIKQLVVCPCPFEALAKMRILYYLQNQGGRGHLDLNYTGIQSWLLHNYDWLVPKQQCPNFSTINLYLQKGEILLIIIKDVYKIYSPFSYPLKSLAKLKSCSRHLPCFQCLVTTNAKTCENIFGSEGTLQNIWWLAI